VQIARPEADIADGAWTPSTGVDLYATLDEVNADDADYDQSALSPEDDQMYLDLTPLSVPQPGQVSVNIRAWRV
jgi:hypothetical protein